MSRQGQIKIVVAACTRQRPGMLRGLLESWAELQPPKDSDVSFLIVENDTERRSLEIVNEFKQRLPLNYALESELGIPAARNRAAKEAVSSGSDLLAFMDDDETAMHDWLTKLVAGWRTSDAVLLGGPLRALRSDEDLTKSEAEMLDNVMDRYRTKETRSFARDPGNVTIVTNNWLAETSLFSQHDIWFDLGMRETGGSDARFCGDVWAKGLKTAWVPDAIVSEIIPRGRLSFAYQHRRAASQSNVYIERKLDKSRWNWLRLFPVWLGKILVTIGLSLSLPITKDRLKLARTSGWVVGFLRALFGKRSQLYAKLEGY